MCHTCVKQRGAVQHDIDHNPLWHRIVPCAMFNVHCVHILCKFNVHCIHTLCNLQSSLCSHFVYSQWNASCWFLYWQTSKHFMSKQETEVCSKLWGKSLCVCPGSRNLVSIWHFYWEYCVFYTFIDNFLQRLNINKTTFLRKIQIVCGVSFPQIPLAYGTTLDRSYLFKILSNLRFSFPSFPCFLARSSLCDRRPLAKTLKLAVWAFSLFHWFFCLIPHCLW